MSKNRRDVQDRTPEKAKELKTYVQAIAAILYEETPEETLNTLDRNRTDSTPKGTQARQSRNWCFFIQAVTGTITGRKRRLKSSIGILKLTKNQAKKLKVAPRTQLSPYLEKCCLLLSANVSYANTARDLESLTGLRISHSTQQRLVQRHKFSAVRVNQEVEELTVDGGKVRLRTPKGQGCEWRDYKAVNLDGQAVAAYFQDNKALLHWVNQQQLSEIVSCIGDGHDGQCESHCWHCH